MATLHLIGGEKGGTGKSLVARTAAQYHLDRGIEFALFDADRHNPDVKRAFQPPHPTPLRCVEDEDC